MATDDVSRLNACAPVFLSTFPPRRCGLATFTDDLVRSINLLGSMSEAKVIAVSNDGASYTYDGRVLWEIRQENMDSYIRAARLLNSNGKAVVSLQHEFGIFGGLYGSYIMGFLDNTIHPVVTTFHTVLPAPTGTHRRLVEEIASKSARVVVMARKGKEILVERYGIPAEKVEVIPHGVPVQPPTSQDRALLKEIYGFGGRKVISTFGLLNPGKGIEHVISAMPRIVLKHPEAIYLILGQTHPVVKGLYGEAYREKLRYMTERLGVSDNVAFIGHYLTRQEVIDYLALTDIYVTPYTNPEQICSGTLAYALSAGKAIVSTPYLYAVEVLADGRGILTAFDDPNSLADAITALLDDDRNREKLERAAYEYGKRMGWPEVANSYVKLFAEVSEVA